MRLILASSSPRRADLLRAAGFQFDVAPADVDERVHPGEGPDQYVARLAQAKADACGAADAVVLGADTTVVLRGAILGKPADEADARRMLERLSGQRHQVLTGLCLRQGSRRLVHVEPSQVRFSDMSAAEIDWYVGSGEPMGKAGAYAVQGLGIAVRRGNRGIVFERGRASGGRRLWPPQTVGL